MSTLKTNRLSSLDGSIDVGLEDLLIKPTSVENLGEYRSGVTLENRQQGLHHNDEVIILKPYQKAYTTTGEWEEDKNYLTKYSDPWNHQKLNNRNKPNAHDASAVSFKQEGNGSVTRSVGDKLRESLSVKDYGVVGDGVTDDTEAFNRAITAARLERKWLYAPAAEYYISGTLELGGLRLKGDYQGFFNVSGTRFIGNGSNTMFRASTSEFIEYGHVEIDGISITNVESGIDFGFLNRSSFKNIYIENENGTGLVVGRPTNSGPQWNEFYNVRVTTHGGSALTMNGAQWCNNNTFVNCFFESVENGLIPCAIIDCQGGWGALGNVFIGCEFASHGYGLLLLDAQGTQILTGYYECYGPSIHLSGRAKGTTIVGGVYGRLRNNNITGHNAYILYDNNEKRSNILSITGGHATFSGQDQSDCVFMGYTGTVPPSPSLSINIIEPPSLEIVNAANVKMFKDGLFNNITNNYYGKMRVLSDDQPSISIGFQNGSDEFKIRRNGYRHQETGAVVDVGIVFENNGQAAAQITNSNRMLFKKEIGLLVEDHNFPPGNKTHRAPVYNSEGQFIGYIPIYSS